MLFVCLESSNSIFEFKNSNAAVLKVTILLFKPISTDAILKKFAATSRRIKLRFLKRFCVATTASNTFRKFNSVSLQ